MLKVLIVDDEAIVRIGLKSMINWEEHGFCLVGEANDGRKAVELFHKHRPDLVITDLKMPTLDGLELIREINKLKTICRIIVLSSYDDFNLVREAMKLGASEYLLKLEMEPHHLISTLEGFRKEIATEYRERSRQAEIAHEMKTNLAVLRKAFFKETICSGDLDGLSTLFRTLAKRHSLKALPYNDLAILMG